MTVTTPAEHLIYASGGDSVIRHLSIGGRAIVFADVVTGIGQDADSNGIIYLDHTNSWAGSGVQPHMTVDIGTTAGARDIGSVRLRYNNSTNTRMTIAETAPAELPVQLGHHITVRNEYLPWSIPKRTVLTRDVNGNITAVTEYLDYDQGYSGGANSLLAKANITDGLNADGSVKEVRRARWVDGYGTGGEQAFATFTLSAAASVAHNNGATITGWAWTFTGNGALVGGQSFTAQTTAFELDAGFHYISLFVQDSTGNLSPVNQIGVWVHNDAYPPLANFAVTSDETEFGRELQIEFFGDANEADVTVIPERSLVCYWEEADYDGGAPGESYRSECVGWVTDDEPLLKLDASRYGIKLGATHAWKTKFRANSVTIINTGATPTTWTEMENMTIDRLIDWSLRAVDTLRNLINVYYTGVTVEVERATLPLGDAWTHLTETAPKAAMAQPRCDRYGNLWLRRHYSYLRDSVRSTVNTAFAATGDDWTDADGLTLPMAFIRRAGVVNGAAELWSAGSRILYASRAPGLRESYGLASIKLPDQFVGQPTPQSDLNALAGYHYWHENNPRPSVTLALLGNLDVIEPAWMEPVALTWTETTIRGTQLNSELFIVRRVSIQHSNETDATTPPKRVTWALEQVTDGAPGETAPVLQMEGSTQVPGGLYNGLNRNTRTLFAISDDGYIYYTYDFDSASPTWARVGTFLFGTPTQYSYDAFCAQGLATGTEVRGWLRTTGTVYRITNGEDPLTLTLTRAINIDTAGDFSFSTLGLAQAQIVSERGTANRVLCVVNTGNNGTTLWTYTLDGVQWKTDAVLSNGGDSISRTPGAFVSGKSNLTLIDAWDEIRKSQTDTPGSGTPIAGFAYGAQYVGDLLVPWAQATDDVIYFGGAPQGIGENRLYRGSLASGAAPTEITPLDGADKYGPVFAHGLDASPENRLRMVMLGFWGDSSNLIQKMGIFTSTDGGDTWAVLLAPAAFSTGSYVHAQMTDDETIFLYGANGAIGLVTDFATIDDKRGDLLSSFPAIGTLIGIWGVG